MESKIKEVFEHLDRDGSETLDIQELGLGLRALGLNPSEEQVQELMKTADTNQDSKIGFEEFQSLFKKCSKLDHVDEQKLKDELSQYDTDGSGFIERDELKRILCEGGESLTEEEAETIIKDFDTNEDGKLSLEELARGLLRIS